MGEGRDHRHAKSRSGTSRPDYQPRHKPPSDNDQRPLLPSRSELSRQAGAHRIDGHRSRESYDSSPHRPHNRPTPGDAYGHEGSLPRQGDRSRRPATGRDDGYERYPLPQADTASGRTRPSPGRQQQSSIPPTQRGRSYADPGRGPGNSSYANPYLEPNRYVNKKKGKKLKPFLIIASLVIILFVGGYFVLQNIPFSVTVNGTSHTLKGAKTVADIVNEGYVKPSPGNLVAVDGSLLEKGAGFDYTVTVNNVEATDHSKKLHNGDKLEIANGKDRMEAFKERVEAVSPTISETGRGPLHVFEGSGAEGKRITRTGTVSGITHTEVQEPSNVSFYRYYPNVGADKVIALTFDDGPWPDSTKQILDILKQNNAKATFFTVGEYIDSSRAPLVKEAKTAGHQVCTHTYSHARGKGGGTNLGAFTKDEQIADVQKGLDAIARATGAEASKVIRAPGGNFGSSCQESLCSLVTAEIGWTVDTGDWKKPGVDKIVGQLLAAQPGDVILMHDGGGDRSQTVEALRSALPQLRAKGYKCITIDEMLAYPAK